MATNFARWNPPAAGGVGALLLALAFPSAHARDAYQCEGLLLPPEEVRATDYTTLQAFAKANPTHLYDAIAKSGAGAGSFGGFSEDFKQSTSKGDFPKRVQKRLQDEKFTFTDAIAKGYYRRGLSDAQLSAWSQCVSQVGQGAVLATAREVGPGGFNLVVAWVPPPGVGTSPLEIDVGGGTIAGLASFQQTMTGRSATSHPIRTSFASGPVKVTVRIGGSTDWVIVNPPTAAAPAAKP